MDQGSTPLMLQILGGLLVLFMLVATYFNTKSWRWPHVTICLFLFAAAIASTILAGYTIKTQHEWRSLVNEYAKRVSKVKEEGQYLSFGSEDPAKAALDNVRQVSAELDRVVQTERGRVWRNCTVTASSPTSVELDIVGPKPEGVVDDQLVFFGLDPAKGDIHKLVFQCFTEKRVELALLYPQWVNALAGSAAMMPDDYVGEWLLDDFKTEIVPAAADGSTPAQLKAHLTLKPRLPLDVRQTAYVADRSKSWTLYEAIPTDMHEVYAELFSTPEGEQRFTELFDIKRFPQDFPKEMYDEIKKQFTDDGKAAKPDHPAGRVWVRVKLKDDLKEPLVFDVDAETAAALGDRYFDTTGRALDPFLRLTVPASAGGAPGTRKAELPAGATLFLPQEEGEKLVSSGKAEKLEIEITADTKAPAIYVRELRDYGQLYHRMAARMIEADDMMLQINIDTARLKEAADDVKKQIAMREEEKTKFAADKEKVDRDRDAVKKYYGELESQFATLKSELSASYRTNLALAAALAAAQERISARINSATGGAAPAASPAAPNVPRGPATN